MNERIVNKNLAIKPEDISNLEYFFSRYIESSRRGGNSIRIYKQLLSVLEATEVYKYSKHLNKNNENN